MVLSKEVVKEVAMSFWEQRLRPKNCWIVNKLDQLGHENVGGILMDICEQCEGLEVHKVPKGSGYSFWVGPKGKAFVELQDEEKVAAEVAQRVLEKVGDQRCWLETTQRLSLASYLQLQLREELGDATLGAVYAMLEDWVAGNQVGQAGKERLIDAPWEWQPARPVDCEKLGMKLRDLLEKWRREKKGEVELSKVKSIFKEAHGFELFAKDYGFQTLLQLMEHLEDLGYLVVAGKGTTCHQLRLPYGPSPDPAPVHTPRAPAPVQPAAMPTPAVDAWHPQTCCYPCYPCWLLLPAVCYYVPCQPTCAPQDWQ